MIKRMRTGALGVAMVMAAVQSSVAQEPSRPNLKLPEERLTIVAGNSMGAIFLAPDSIVWTGRSAIVLTYTLFQPGRAVDGKIVTQEVERKRFDCSAHTYQSLGSEGFDADDRSVVWLPEGEAAAIRERTMTSRMAKVVCGEVQLPPGNTVANRIAAKTMAAQTQPNKP
jgi:hypothetical protein